MKTQQLPFMSIVIACLNGERDLGRAIESLLAQDYPRDRFEIIVVDDGSTDRTFEVASTYPVRVVQHPKNLGVASARSTSLWYVRGDVYVCFDHDCIVKPDWLRKLAAGYELPNVLGVGSVNEHPKNVTGLIDRFMVAARSGMPPRLTLGASRGPLKRFIAYIVDQLAISEDDYLVEPYQVRQLNGATGSFPVEVLKKVGGWDTRLRWIEDTEICARLAKAYPARHFYAMPAARVIHDPKMGAKTFVRRTYLRGVDNLRYYKINKLVPPVFPFPLAWLALCIIAAIYNPVLGLVTALLSPQLLYIWWPIRAVREASLWNLAFPYLQLTEELSTIAGLVRAELILSKENGHAKKA